MFKTIVPKATFKELKKIDTPNRRIVYLKENDILVITLIRIAHRKEVY